MIRACVCSSVLASGVYKLIMRHSGVCFFFFFNGIMRIYAELSRAYRHRNNGIYLVLCGAAVAVNKK